MIIKRSEWKKSHYGRFKVSAGDDIEYIAEEVKNGKALLFECRGERTNLDAVVRLENKTAVIVLGEGRGVKHVMPLFLRDCAKNGINSLRVHVKRSGAIKMFERHGFTVSETILEMRL